MADIGTEKWYRTEARYAHRGVVDSILRLFEQGEITRPKARELIFYATGHVYSETPDAPWETLNWHDAALRGENGGEGAKQ